MALKPNCFAKPRESPFAIESIRRKPYQSFNEELIYGVEGNISDTSRSSHAIALDEKMENLSAFCTPCHNLIADA
jgi:hypothetical protein